MPQPQQPVCHSATSRGAEVDRSQPLVERRRESINIDHIHCRFGQIANEQIVSTGVGGQIKRFGRIEKLDRLDTDGFAWSVRIMRLGVHFLQCDRIDDGDRSAALQRNVQKRTVGRRNALRGTRLLLHDPPFQRPTGYERQLLDAAAGRPNLPNRPSRSG